MNLSDYVSLPIEQRKAHLNLSLPCEFGSNRNWTHKRDELLKFFDVINDSSNWLIDGIHRCHACSNDSGSKSICLNPHHWWIGTASENAMSRPLEKRQAGGKAVRGIPKSPESIAKRAEKLRGQTRSHESKERMRLQASRRFRCLVTGVVKSPSQLTRHQNKLGIDTSLREEVTR